MKIVFAFLLACFVGTAAMPASGKVDLMALKKQEEERRKKLGKAKIKITNDNVNSISGGGKPYGFVQVEGGGSSPAGEETAPQAAEEEGNEEKRPDYWQKQKSELEEKISGLKAEIDGAQLELNKLWSDFYLKSVAAEQQVVRDRIAQKTGEIEQKKLQLKESGEQLEGLYERARKAGVPPGWLR
jgi:hypothetical protein